MNPQGAQPPDEPPGARQPERRRAVNVLLDAFKAELARYPHPGGANEEDMANRFLVSFLLAASSNGPRPVTALDDDELEHHVRYCLSYIKVTDEEAVSRCLRIATAYQHLMADPDNPIVRRRFEYVAESTVQAINLTKDLLSKVASPSFGNSLLSSKTGSLLGLIRQTKDEIGAQDVSPSHRAKFRPHH
jgi:hypothetical protein